MARRYEQRIRAESAERTRRRILDALYEQLRAKPTTRISVGMIAERADVSRSTVYLLFESRSGLFDAVGGDLLSHRGFERVMRAVDGDAVTGVLDTLSGVTEMYAAHLDVLRALHSMASLDPDAVAHSIPRMENGRRAGMRALVDRLHEQRRLADGVSVEEARRVLTVLTAFGTVDALLRESDAAAVVNTLSLMASRTLFADPIA